MNSHVVDIGFALLAESVVLAQGIEDGSVPAHGNVHDPFGVVGKLVLFEHSQADVLRVADRTVRGVLTRKNAQQRRLATSVGAHQTIALPRVQLKANAFEQGLLAVVLG